MERPLPTLRFSAAPWVRKESKKGKEERVSGGRKGQGGRKNVRYRFLTAGIFEALECAGQAACRGHADGGSPNRCSQRPRVWVVAYFLKVFEQLSPHFIHPLFETSVN